MNEQNFQIEAETFILILPIKILQHTPYIPPKQQLSLLKYFWEGVRNFSLSALLISGFPGSIEVG